LEQRKVSVRLFLREGLPKGMRTAEIVGWTGMALICPRSTLDKFQEFPRADSAAVYLLLGEDEDGTPMVYIGQSRSVNGRLKKHIDDDTKSFFDTIIAFVSKDENLTTAHVTYLEARLVKMAKEARRVRVNNTNQGLIATGLPESDVADMNNFINNITMLLLTLGVNVFEIVAVAPASSPSSIQPLFQLQAAVVQAKAIENGGEFVVLKDSQSRGSIGAQDSYKGQRDKLIATGALMRQGDDRLFVFTQDTPFKSVSAAAAVVLGRNANGRKEWKVSGTNQTYADWEASKVASVERGEHQSGPDESGATEPDAGCNDGSTTR